MTSRKLKGIMEMLVGTTVPCLILKQKIPSDAKLVWAYIREWRGFGNERPLDRKLMSKFLGMSRKQIDRAIKFLVRRNWVELGEGE